MLHKKILDKVKTGKTLTISLICFLAPLSLHAHDDKLPTVPEETFQTESNVRELLNRLHPGIRTHFYYYDGKQIFGLFQDPKTPGKIILVILPSGGILRFDCRVGGEKTELKCTPIRYRVRYKNPSSNQNQKGSYSFSNGSIGLMIDTPKSKNTQFDIRIRQELGEWLLWAVQNRDGGWDGGMKMIRRYDAKISGMGFRSNKNSKKNSEDLDLGKKDDTHKNEKMK